jgi:sarcosine oxidase
MNYDVVVIGLGGMGSAILYRLAKEGLRVLGIERFHIAHTNGSSHGKTRIIRQACYEHPDYVPLSLRAYQLWQDLDGGEGRLMTITGGLMIGSPDSSFVRGSIESAQSYNLSYELLTATQCRSRFPYFAIADGHAAFYERTAGIVHPELAVSRFIDLAKRFHADVILNEQVAQINTTGARGVEVRTPNHCVSAQNVVLSAGPWNRHLFPALGHAITVQRVLTQWYEPASHIDARQCQSLPVFLWDTGRYHLYGSPPPCSGGRRVKIGFDDYRSTCNPDTIVRHATRDEALSLTSLAHAHVPQLAATLQETNICMYSTTPDGHFMLGRHPRCDRLVLAGGFSGRGFKFVPVIAEIVADLIIRKSTQHSIRLFDPARYMLQIA